MSLLGGLRDVDMTATMLGKSSFHSMWNETVTMKNTWCILPLSQGKKCKWINKIWQPEILFINCLVNVEVKIRTTSTSDKNKLHGLSLTLRCKIPCAYSILFTPLVQTCPVRPRTHRRCILWVVSELVLASGIQINQVRYECDLRWTEATGIGLNTV